MSFLNLQPIDGLNLKDAIPFLERLGQCAKLGYLRRKPKPTGEERIQALETGLTVVKHWPGMFLESLDRIVEGARAAGITVGATKSYGWVYHAWIAAPLHADIADLLRPLLKSHAVTHGIISPEPKWASPTMNATDAARELGMGYARARSLLVAESLMPPSIRQGLENVIPADRVKALRTRVKSTLNIRKVAQRLGTTKTRIRAISDLSLLTKVNDGILSGYRADDVDALVRRMTKGLAIRGCNPKGLLPLPLACRAKRIKIAVALKAILDGTVIVRGQLSNASGLHQLLVCPSDLNILRPKIKAVPIAVVARRLGIHHDAVLGLLRGGALGKRLGLRKNFILESDIAAFEQRYIPAARIARSTGMTVRAIVCELLAHDIAPPFAPPRCRQIIFKKSDALRCFPQLR